MSNSGNLYIGSYRNPNFAFSGLVDQVEIYDRSLTSLEVSDLYNGGNGLDCSSVTSPVCGNGIIESGEQCDDGNLVDGDGCSSTCQIEIMVR